MFRVGFNQERNQTNMQLWQKTILVLGVIEGKHDGIALPRGLIHQLWMVGFISRTNELIQAAG